MHKKGFTIVELVISVTIMFLVIASAPVIFNKKANETKEIAKITGTFVCNKDSANYNSGVCSFTPKDEFKYEFYTITLIGGGAGGSKVDNGRAGEPGEVKEIYYQALQLKNKNIDHYEMQLGAGGAAGKNGGKTIFYSVDKNGNPIKILGYANGGITSSEKVASDSPERTGKGPRSETTGTSYGKGGNGGQNGEMGEVIIAW